MFNSSVLAIVLLYHKSGDLPGPKKDPKMLQGWFEVTHTENLPSRDPPWSNWISFTAWFEVNRTISSREIMFLILGGHILPPPAFVTLFVMIFMSVKKCRCLSVFLLTLWLSSLLLVYIWPKKWRPYLFRTLWKERILYAATYFYF